MFSAPDSLLGEFTIWRGPDPPLAENLTGMHLYITEVDTLGVPDPSRIVLDGPTLVLGDTSSFPRAVTYQFDPPFALAHRGTFAAAIKEEDPYCSTGFSLQVDSTASYPCGQLWLIHKYVDCHGLGVSAQLLDGNDLRFQAKFVCPDSTSAEPASWGKVKATYR